MAFTNNSDFYFAIREEGINRLMDHFASQRPSFFNYASNLVKAELLCKQVIADSAVTAGANPIMAAVSVEPIKIPGSEISPNLNFCLQFTSAQVDFHPQNIFVLPQGLSQIFKPQMLALYLNFCIGLGCLSSSPQPPTKLECSSLDVFALSKLDKFLLKLGPTEQIIDIHVDLPGLDIVDIKPEGLKNFLICSTKQFFPIIVSESLKLVPNLYSRIIMLSNGKMKSVSVSSPTISNNPVIEDNQMKTFYNLDGIELNIPISSQPSTPSPTQPPAPPKQPTTPLTLPPVASKKEVARATTDPSHITAAISKNCLSKLFNAMIKGFSASFVGRWPKDGNVYIGYSVAFHLDNGTINLNDDNTLEIKELDVKWDTLEVTINIDVPSWSTPRFNVPGIPVNITIPSFGLFQANPDIKIPMSLNKLLTTEISATFLPKIFYGEGGPNRWQIYIIPQLPFDVDIIDIADTTGDIARKIKDAVAHSIDELVEPVFSSINRVIDKLDIPGVDLLTLGGIDNLRKKAKETARELMKDLINKYVRDIDNRIRNLLDAPDDFAEWVFHILVDADKSGLFKIINDSIKDYFTNRHPLFEIEDPITIIPKGQHPFFPTTDLIPVKTPIEYIGVEINSNEMMILADIGKKR